MQKGNQRTYFIKIAIVGGSNPSPDFGDRCVTSDNSELQHRFRVRFRYIQTH